MPILIIFVKKEITALDTSLKRETSVVEGKENDLVQPRVRCTSVRVYLATRTHSVGVRNRDICLNVGPSARTCLVGRSDSVTAQGESDGLDPVWKLRHIYDCKVSIRVPRLDING